MKFIKVLLLVGLMFSVCCGAFAEEEGVEQPSATKAIKSIDVKGNVSINKNIILTQIKSKPGDLFLRDLINEDLRRIYSLGYFSDISIDVQDEADGVTLIFVVVEKFSIKSINIQDCKVFRDSVLLKEMDIKEGEIFNKRLVQEAMKKIETKYKAKGYFNVKTDLLVETDMPSRQVGLTVKVTENKKIYVKKIIFEGNANVKDKLLKKQMHTKEKWFFGGGLFNEEALQEDLEKLAAFYRTKGFMNIYIGEPEITYSDNKVYVFINIPVTEGELYKTGIIEILGNELFPTSDLKATITMKEGETFSQQKMLEDQRSLHTYFAEKGYIFAIVRPSTYIDTDFNKIDITYTITENDLAYIEKIIIQGNTRTKDKVIRRNLLVHPLEPFDGKKLQRSKEKLFNLNYFEDVEFDTVPGTKEDHRDLVVNVKEKKTGEFSFGGGYSSLDGMIGFLEIAQNNFDIMNFPTFIGGGQSMRIRTEIGSSKSSYEVGFTEPWLFDKPLLAGFDIYSRKWNRSDYDEDRKGYDLRFGHPILGDDNYFSCMFKQEKVDITITDRANASNEIILEEGEKKINSMLYTFTRDTRDSYNFPTRGYKSILSLEPAGGLLGGDLDIIKYFGSTDHFWKLWKKDFILETRGRMGAIDKYEDTNTVPVYERFFVGGGSTVRGYKERSIGPKGTNLDSIGGSSMIVLNAEVSFPLLNPIRGAVFADAGNAWTGGNDWDFGDLKKGLGVGVRIKTPFGPVKLDYGFALDNADYEDDSRLHFSMGGFF